MIREDIFGSYPQIAPSAYVDDTAVLIGNIVVGENVYIGPNVVIRADEVDEKYKVGKIVIKDKAAIYDGANISTIGASEITIGEGTVISNGVIIKGECHIGNYCNINVKSIIFNSYIGDNCYVGISAVLENVKMPENTMVESGVFLKEDNMTGLIKPVSEDKINIAGKITFSNKVLINWYKFSGY
jgi:carbonic anhydrase/acetyltransferase-like protein (isoleucine patch superfamily)